MTRHIGLFILSIFGLINAFGQKFSGQWKGFFVDNSATTNDFYGQTCDYVLELDVTGSEVTGSSYTYFTEAGKKYYTICKVEGNVNQKTKTIVVKETGRIKTNIPSTIQNCFQEHVLTYEKQGDSEIITGTWHPAPAQGGGCGFGTTTLSRRGLKSIYTQSTAGTNNATKNNKTNTVAKTKSYTTTKSTAHQSSSTKKSTTNTQLAKIDVSTNPSKSNGNLLEHQDELPIVIKMAPETRKTTVLKTVEVRNKNFRVDLYDNGDIDGDSVSLYFNHTVVLSSKRLTDKPISLYLTFDEQQEANELMMFAENLGTIPPNTALMVITDGITRNEVRISSDLEKSGVIKFKLAAH